MNERDSIFSEIADSLIDILDGIQKVVEKDDVALCLNVHTDSRKYKYLKNDKTNFRVWYNLVVVHDYVNTEVFLNDDPTRSSSIIEQKHIDKNKLDKAMKVSKRIKWVRFIYRLIALILGLLTFILAITTFSVEGRQQCKSLPGYFWPIYSQMVNGTETYYQGIIWTGENADRNFILPTDDFFLSNIENVSKRIRILIISYIIGNAILVFIYGLTISYKPKRGIYKAIRLLETTMPIVMIVLLVVMIYVRY